MTPSRLVLLTGGALLATCVFIGAIVAVLHWKEKVSPRFIITVPSNFLFSVPGRTHAEW